ncbi:DUF2510 domain-containing protein [Blastococcus sp. VKM Ac-2987]|uniref:DUF2510 domain-containing protein n=1 Tax=Blastococcus sp. VKM Ac-2987 TaxID=3004141 RepID=UPI0022ABA5C5|nr:DUF2510 domain-containing protein [Blastococcus sp. VKM Ac-2987]MCZ2859634.1 DUF2510 domain-containing protein [Blastococcus sp. VKM Ac-2987]
MTGVGQDAAPGWYPDPSGVPDTVRWWDGTGWSDVMMPAGPGVAVHRAPARPETPLPAAPAAPGEERPWLRPLMAAGSVLALVVAVVVTVLVVRPDGGRGTGTTTAQDLGSVPPAAGPAFPPGTVRIFDQAAGISYPYLGEGWSEWALWDQVETTETAGQYFVTQELTPDGTTFISQCSSGPLFDAFGYSGPASLAATTEVVADSVRRNYYPGPNEREVLRNEPRTVDGHAAHLYEFALTWDVEGFDASGERAALLLIDVGRPAPALLYVSIPNTHAELYGVIDRVVDAVDVL